MHASPLEAALAGPLDTQMNGDLRAVSKVSQLAGRMRVRLKDGIGLGSSPCRESIEPQTRRAHTVTVASSAGDTSWKGRTGNRWWYDRARWGDDTSVSPQTWHAVGSSSTRACVRGEFEQQAALANKANERRHATGYLTVGAWARQPRGFG